MRCRFNNTTLFALGVALSFSATVRAEVATDAEMLTVCENWLAQTVHTSGSWAGDVAPTILDTQEIVSGDTVLAKVFSISPQGYVVVPVLKELPPVKAYSARGQLDADQAYGFPQLLREVLEHRIETYVRTYGSLDVIQERQERQLFGTVNRQEWDRLVVDSDQFVAGLARGSRGTGAGPMLTSVWHQGPPYNNSCPAGDTACTVCPSGGTPRARTVVGCVATATAQIMNYWQWPPTGTLPVYSYDWDGDDSCDGSPSSATLSAILVDPYDWANMPDDCAGGCTPAEEAAAAELSYEVAVVFEMDFGRCGSGTPTDIAVGKLPFYFGYDPGINKQDRPLYDPATWFGMIQTEVNAGRPVLYRIKGHAIVSDGWQVFEGSNFYHMNYGWGGSQNAWFAIDNLHCDWDGCTPIVEYMVRNIVPVGATPNQPAICDTGGPYEVECLGKVMLDGRNSYDPDGTIISYVWSLDADCPAGSTLANDTTSTPVLLAGSDGNCTDTCTVHLEVTENGGLVSECKTVVAIMDTEPPIVTAPDNERVDCLAEVPPPDTSVVQATDCNTVQVSWIRDLGNGGGGCPGDPLIISRTYRVRDVCGNPPVDWVQTFTVVDDVMPEFTVFPADANLQCRGMLPLPDTSLIQATDNCAGAVDIMWEGDIDNSGEGCPGDALIVWRTYRITDSCGNYVERMQTFTIVDDTPPVFTEFPPDEDLQCISELPEPDTSLVEATDNCVGPVEITWEGDADNGGKGCPGDPLIVTRTYRATDICDNSFERNQTFTIVDTIEPTISCSITNEVQPVEVDENCEAYVEFSVTVTDNCCVDPADVVIQAFIITNNATLGEIELDPLPDPAAEVTVTGRVMVSDLLCCPATVLITAEATDCCGHPTPQCSSMVDVIDNYPPAGACGLTRDHPGCSAIDNLIELTANEPTYWSALSGMPKGTAPFDTLDPGWLPGRPDPDSVDSGDRVLRGYVVAWAVNEFGEEIRWNHLKGDALLINYEEGSAWEYEAWAFPAMTGDHGNPTGTAGVLNLDGTEYASGFDQLLLDFYAPAATLMSSEFRTATVVDTDLTLLPLNIDLRQDNNGPTITKARFEIWNMNEWKFSGTERCITCWDQTLLTNYDPPNEFLRNVLQTDKGKARIDGMASTVCPGSVDAPLLGVAMKLLDIGQGQGIARAGMNLVGAGVQGGLIQADVLGPPPLAPPTSALTRDIRKGTPAIAEAAAMVRAATTSQKGSLLIFPKAEIRWDWCGNVIQDTYLDLTNDYPGNVRVQMYFVNGDLPEPATLPRCIVP